MKQSEKNYKRIVIKIGSSLIYANKALDYAFLEGIIRQIAQLIKGGIEVVLVSSGAIATGMFVLKFDARPKELSSLQALAAVGQHFLMSEYRKCFERNELECAQVLLTWDDFSDRKRYLNAKNTLFTLLKLNTIPVINENDTVSTEEIKFGDNDRLSAMVANLISADLLIILSDVDGLMDRAKKTVIRVVDDITPQIKSLAHSTDKKISVGGMITKIEAAKIAITAGIPCIIANGRRRDIIDEIISEPEEKGTLFIPKRCSLVAKKRWLAFGTKTKGKIMVDDGAKKALLNKKSLLSVGVFATQGLFDCGDIVAIVDKEGSEFARGKVNLSHKQLDKVKGIRFDKEVMHCDNIAIL